MRNALPLLLATFAAVAALAVHAAPPLSEQYASCTQSISKDPEGTYKRARVWYTQTKSLASQHCMALSLYELKDFEGAAKALEMMLQGMTPSQGRLWLNMKAQAAKAHYASGNHTAAAKHLSDGIYWATNKEMDGDIVPLLLQRAKIYGFHNENLKAVQDLDHAMSITPSAQVQLQRAKLLIKMDKHGQALEDINAVLQAEPNNKVAQSMRAIASR